MTPRTDRRPCAALALAAVVLTSCTPPEAIAVRPVVVLYSLRDPAQLRLDCPAAECTRIAVEELSCRAIRGAAEVVIVGGHSLPPDYLHTTPDSLAQAIACLHAPLVVLDTCYGFSSPLLEALDRHLPAGTRVVGSIHKLPLDGLRYDGDFFGAGTAEQRAGRIHARSGAPLERWRLHHGQLSAALATVAGWDPPTLLAQLQRKLPNLVRVALPGSTATLLVPVPPERFTP